MGTLSVSSEITLNLLRPNSGQIVYAKQFDKASRKITASILSGESEWLIPDGLEIVVMYSKPDGKRGMYDVIEDNTTKAVTKIGPSKIEIILAEQALSVAGNVLVEIAFYTEQEKLTSLSFVVSVEKGVPDNETLTSDNYFNVLSQLIQGLLGATINPPQIDPNTKNWLTWDNATKGYVDSGVHAQGEVGEKGDKGDPGKTPASFRRVSGSGRPGERDEYVCVLNDGEEVGSLTVYNGQDADGAPGTQMPLPDSENGQVGIASAFAHEDHSHPINVSDDLPSDLGEADPGSSTVYARSDHVHRIPSITEIGGMSARQIIDLIYPIGCTYESSDPTSPAELFGGYWDPIEGRFTIAASASYPVKSTGGAATVTLTANQSGQRELSISGGGHTHSVNTKYKAHAVETDTSTSGTHQFHTSGESSTSAMASIASNTGRHTHSVAAANATQAHNNMPPYVAYYKWERVAPPE